LPRIVSNGSGRLPDDRLSPEDEGDTRHQRGGPDRPCERDLGQKADDRQDDTQNNHENSRSTAAELGLSRLLPEGAASTPMSGRRGDQRRRDGQPRDSGRRRNGYSSMPEVAWQANLSQASFGTVHELGGDCDKLATLGASLRPQLFVGRSRREAPLADQDALRLLDDRSGVQRTLQLRG
jgi:hypothetical protein